MSLVTGDSGTLLIFEDSIQEEDLDDWLGEADKAIAQIDWSDYLEYVATEIIPEDESKWKGLLEDYLESMI